MTVGSLIEKLATLPKEMPVALLLDTDGKGLDLGRPAGALVRLGKTRRPFFDGMELAEDTEVLVLVTANSFHHHLLVGE